MGYINENRLLQRHCRKCWKKVLTFKTLKQITTKRKDDGSKDKKSKKTKKSAIKIKSKIDFWNCLETTILENETNHVEKKMKLMYIALTKTIKNS